MERRTFLAMVSGGLFAAPLAAGAQTLLRYEGTVQWIAGSTMVVMTDEGLSVRVDLTRVSQSEYSGLVPRDRIRVAGMLSQDGNYLLGVSIQRTRLEYQSS